MNIFYTDDLNLIHETFLKNYWKFWQIIRKNLCQFPRQYYILLYITLTISKTLLIPISNTRKIPSYYLLGQSKLKIFFRLYKNRSRDKRGATGNVVESQAGGQMANRNERRNFRQCECGSEAPSVLFLLGKRQTTSTVSFSECANTDPLPINTADSWWSVT